VLIADFKPGSSLPGLFFAPVHGTVPIMLPRATWLAFGWAEADRARHTI